MVLKIIRYPNRKLYFLSSNPRGFKTRYTSLFELINLIREGYGIQCYSAGDKRDYTKDLLYSIVKLKEASELASFSIGDLTSQLRANPVPSTNV